jgi:UDP-N-acetylmuramate dehydrogenase
MTDSLPTTLPDPIPGFARERLIELAENEPMARHVSMGVGGPARWLLVAHDRTGLTGSIKALRAAGIPWMVLGGGSNTIFGDAGFAGVVVRLGRDFRVIRVIESGPGANELTAGAGANLSAVMNAAKRAGLAGLEWAAGVPGTLGGALAGNSGTPAGDACSAAEQVEILGEDGAPAFLERGQFTFGYRRCSLAGQVILGATLRLAPDAAEAIGARIEAGLAKRRAQPLGQRSSGCIFKNPPGDSAGRLIDAAGLKGLSVGGARIAAEHANFIVCDGSATAADVVALAAETRRRVRDRWGVKLELEVRLVGLDSRERID